MEHCEYMKVRLSIIPQEIVEQYKMTHLAQDGWIYINIRKGMYGIPQVGILSNLKL